MKKENPAVVAVHGIAHVVELAWADAIEDRPLINRIFTTNQRAYTYYSKSGKKRLSFKACCKC